MRPICLQHAFFRRVGSTGKAGSTFPSDALAFAAAALFCAAGQAAGADLPRDLYRTTAIVTGTSAENSRAAITDGFLDVLVKVSGDPKVRGEPAALSMALHAAAMIAALSYRDRLAHLPVHDEQGTRDRPHDLTMTFDESAIDRALASVGRAPWADRPRIAVLVTWELNGARHSLVADDEAGRSRREALGAAARIAGLQVSLPDAVKGGVRQRTGWIDAGRSELEALAQEAGGAVALAGDMIFVEKELGWRVLWRLAGAGHDSRWELRGVNFDKAFRNGLRGAAQILSGHGEPGDIRAPGEIDGASNGRMR